MLQGWITLAVMGVWAARGADGEMARRMQRSGPGLTSSTLEWVDAESGQPLPAGALQADENLGAWCRFADHGHVAGVVREGVCHAPFLNTVVTSEKYEALVSINDSARLVEIEWSRAAAMTPGGIQVSKRRVLGLARGLDGTVLPGFVDVANRLAYMLNDTQAEKVEDAVILAEDEPVSYEVDKVLWNEAKAETQAEDQLLLTVKLENPDGEAKLVSKVAEYTATDVLYWGNVRGTVKGLTAKVTGPGGQVWEVTWGAHSDFERVADQVVSLEVPAGAYVDVKLVGVIHKFNSPYSARLTAIYKDGTKRSRPVTAPHQHQYLAELRADFNHPRSLADDTEVEGSFPTSEVLIASTTTTTTTTTIAPPPGTVTGEETAGSLATPETNMAMVLTALPNLLAFCLAFMMRLAYP